MTLQELQTQDYRRSALWFLLYDPDYQLSDSMLHSCFIAHGKRLSLDLLKTTMQWLCEQGLTTVTTNNGIDNLALTDRGLEVAKGIVNAIGVRDLRPSERAEIQAINGY